jgi:Kef-type K+ transport system membrane component KefB
MNELASLGLILLVALLAGHLVKVIGVPEVTGYLLAGIAVGPSGVGWVSHENVEGLHLFSEVALGLILFSIGGVFEITRIRQAGRRLLALALAESMLAAVFVLVGMLLVGQPWRVSLLLGVIAISTGAASTLMVLRESNATGPLTEALTAVIALNNIIALVGFSVVALVLDMSAPGSEALPRLAVVAQAIFPLVWQILGSASLGFLVGILLASWASKVVESGETLILLIGCVLLTVGIAGALGLSPLVASLTVGATLANLSARSRRLFAALTHTDPPLYVIFFVLAGADLDLGLLRSLGIAGIVYVICRSGGKLLGAWYAARRAGFPETVQRLLGFSILAQAGLAVGLVLLTQRRFPDLGPTVAAVVLAGVVIFEIAGPLSARLAINRSGESRAQGNDGVLAIETELRT